ncbi:hypothetical protein LX32DRAFT_165711 [Colletotrichum zoysiae]|uniref:Uncharacterized protein n=1 Tax=Colletotrichum zoysiae TaxID=1216348 RepID=A0AAD9LVU1_9PEZI|nr:hypothetical protein LX32DRAFT_165711 [Colletotrichum zoysiae]
MMDGPREGGRFEREPKPSIGGRGQSDDEDHESREPAYTSSERMRHGLYLSARLTHYWMMASEGLRWGERLLTCMLLVGMPRGPQYGITDGLGPCRESARDQGGGDKAGRGMPTPTMFVTTPPTLAGLVPGPVRLSTRQVCTYVGPLPSIHPAMCERGIRIRRQHEGQGGGRGNGDNCMCYIRMWPCGQGRNTPSSSIISSSISRQSSVLYRDVGRRNAEAELEREEKKESEGESERVCECAYACVCVSV